MGCCVCVEESHVGLVESFGKYSRIAEPGVTCLNCFTERVAGELSLRVEQHKIDVETRSKDNVFVTIRMAVQYKVAANHAEFPKNIKLKKKSKSKSKEKEGDEEIEMIDDDDSKPFVSAKLEEKVLYDAYYKLNRPVDQILAYLEEYFRFHGMEYTLDEMFAAKNDMTNELQLMLNKKMNPYGYIILNVLVIDIDPDEKVKAAMNDIIASEKEKRAQQSRAEAEKITKILGAEAEAKTRELAGEGIAAARKAIVSGLQESVENFQKAIPDADSSQVMVTVLMTQYLDTIKEAAANSRNTFIMPSSPAQVSTMEEQLRMAILSSGNSYKEKK